MSAFVLVEVDIHDPEVYEEYKKLTPGSIEPYGGKFVIRGNPVQVMEGEWKHDRLVLLEFPDKESACLDGVAHQAGEKQIRCDFLKICDSSTINQPINFVKYILKKFYHLNQKD